MPSRFIKDKRCQITIFIIIGIVIVMAASFVFFLARNRSSIDTKQALSAGITETQAIRSFVQDCVDNAAKQSIILLGLQGGHVYLPEKRIDLQDYSIAYDYYEGQNLLPTKEQIEEDMSKYVSENVVRCIDESKSKFSSEFAFGKIKTIAKLNDDDVSFDVSYPITTKYFEKTEILDGNYKAKIAARLAYILNATRQVVESEMQTPGMIDFPLLTSFDLTVNILYYDDSTNIYLFTDSKSQINQKNYTFVFANKLNENMPPYLFSFDTYEITPGQRLIIKAKAFDPEGDELTYSSGAEQVLPIDKNTGSMRFYTPTNPDGTPIPGTYTFTIKATDSHGNYDEKKLTITVKG